MRSGQLQQKRYTNVRLEERSYGESVGGLLPEMGSMARCGCRWDEENERVIERVGCRLHRRRSKVAVDCVRCGDLGWIQGAPGWRAWMLKKRCPECNPLEALELTHLYLRRTRACGETMDWIFRGKVPGA
jgi:hypothetical protein